MTVLPFSQALRERTWSSHSDSEGSEFLHELMRGDGTREDYTALVVQHYFIYAALENAERVFATDPVVAGFVTPSLTRIPALEADLIYLLGDDWQTKIAPLPTTAVYTARIRQIAEEKWSGGFIAHHYTRYLGDLSGGQFIRKVMQRRFGFETNGVGFYIFTDIANPQAFKEKYREQLDVVHWDDAERERVIEEVLRAYRFNTEVFEDLSRAKTAA